MRAISNLDLGTLKFKFDADTTGAEQKLTGAKGKIQSLGATSKDVGKTLSKFITLPLVALGTASLKTAVDFEYGMAKVQATMGATKEQMGELTDKAKELGKSTMWSASNVSEAFNFMAMAGWDAQQSLSGIAPILDLATASGTDLALTSDIVTDGLTGMGMKAEEAGRFADVMAAASSNANTNVAMMGETFKYVSPVAGALGMSIEDLSIVTGLMANTGIKASQSGTAMRSMFTNLVKPTDSMAAAMEKYGIELVKNEDGTSNLMATVNLLRDKLGGLEKQEQANVVSTIAGKTAMAGWLSVINASERDVDKLSNAINNSDGATKKMADTMEDTAMGNVQAFKSAVEGLFIEIGEKLIPTFRKCVEKLTDLISWFGNLDDGTQKVIIGVGALLAVMPPLITLFGSLSLAIGGVTAVGGGLAVVGGALTGLLPILAGAGVIIGGVALATKAFGKDVEDTEVKVVQGFNNMVDGIEGASDNTKAIVKEVHTEIEDLKYQFEKGLVDENGVEKDKATLNEFKNNVVSHVDEVEQVIQSNYEKQLQWYNENKANMTQAEQEFWAKTLEGEKAFNDERTESLQAKEEELKQISDNYNNLTVEEKVKANERMRELLNEIQAIEVESRVNNNAEMKALSDAQTMFELEATAERASNLITATAQQRDFKIQEAEAEYLAETERINSLNSLNDTARNELLAKAQEEYSEKKRIANEGHIALLEESGVFNSQMLSAINVATGEILSAEQQKQKQILIEQYGAERVRNQDLQGTLSVQGDLYDTATGRAITSVQEMATAIKNNSMAINGDLSSISPEAQALATEFQKSFKGGEASLNSWVSNLDRNTGLAKGSFNQISMGNTQATTQVKKDLEANGREYKTWSDTISKEVKKSDKALEDNKKASDLLSRGTADLKSKGTANITDYSTITGGALDTTKKKVDDNKTALDVLDRKKIANKSYTVTETRVSKGDKMHGKYTGIARLQQELNSPLLRNAFTTLRNGGVLGRTGVSDGISTAEITRKLDEVIQAINNNRITNIQVDGRTIAREIASPVADEIMWRNKRL